MSTRAKQILATVIPAAVIAIGVLIKWIDAPNAVRDLFRSGRAFMFVLLIGVVWIGLMLVLWRFTKPWIRGSVMTVLSLVMVGALIIPSLGDTVVDEERDDLAAVRVTNPPEDEAPAESSTTTTTAQAGPVHVSTGQIVGIDHRAAGTANVFREPDGSYVVELFEIDVEPGPDYFVYVVPGANQQTPGPEGINLGAMKGNVGTANYAVPAGVALDGEWTVLVWCEIFTVPIGNATQTPV